MEDLASRFADETGQQRYRNLATVASGSFNRVFWNENAGCLCDVTNGPKLLHKCRTKTAEDI
jgi:hypothetical protein